MATIAPDGVAADVALGISDQQAERLQGLRSPGGKRLQGRARRDLGLSAVHILGESLDCLGLLVARGAMATQARTTMTSAADTSSRRAA